MRIRYNNKIFVKDTIKQCTVCDKIFTSQHRTQKFCNKNNIEGMIIPDISLEEYERNYKALFIKYNVSLIFIVTPQTSQDRLRRIDELSTSFIYMVSSASVTGSASEFGQEHIKGFEFIKSQQLTSPILVGFGIHNKSTFSTVCKYFIGAIIGFVLGVLPNPARPTKAINKIGLSNHPFLASIFKFLEALINSFFA